MTGHDRWMILLMIVVAAGCDGSDGGRPSSDEPDVRQVSEAPILEVGGHDPRPDYVLDRVMDATRLSDGRIVVANGGTSELLYYDSTGTHLHTAGGAGDGPGELRGIFQIERLPGDSLRVFSFRPGLTWFSPEGEYVRSELVDVRSIASVPCRLGEGSWSALPDGSFLTVLIDNFGIGGCPPAPTGPWRQSGLILRSSPEAERVDTLAILPATERHAPTYRVYGKDLVLAIGEDRVYVNDTGADEILALGFGGDTLAVLPVPFEARPVPPDARAEALRRWREPDGTERRDSYAYPDQYPRVGRLLADEAGRLWVMAYPQVTEPMPSYRMFRPFAFHVSPAGSEWRVLDEEGQVLAEVRTPPGIFPLEIGEDYVLGLRKDELDVQSIDVHRLSREP